MHLPITVNRKLLHGFTVTLFSAFLGACSSDDDSPPYNCQEAHMQVTIGNSPAGLTVNNNTLFRLPADTGNYKLLTLDASTDTFKIVLNLKTGPYSAGALQNDSITPGVYTYSRQAGPSAGLVVMGVKRNNAFTFPATDTSSITLTHMDYKHQTVTGSYYFVSDNGSVTGKGVFSDVCFISLQ